MSQDQNSVDPYDHEDSSPVERDRPLGPGLVLGVGTDVLGAGLTFADIADADVHLAMHAFESVVGPLMWHQITQGVHRAHRGSPPCPAEPPTRSPSGHYCAMCREMYAERLSKAFEAVRSSLAGAPPTTTDAATGEKVTLRDGVLIADAIRAPWAGDERAAVWGARLRATLTRGRGRPGGPPRPADLPQWALALRQQALHAAGSRTRVIADARRHWAVEQGMFARPAHVLQTAAWAKPVRTADPLDFEVLCRYVVALRDSIAEPESMPDFEAAHGIAAAEVDRRLRRVLGLLAQVRPDFHARAVVAPLARRRPIGGEPVPSPDTDDVFEAASAQVVLAEIARELGVDSATRTVSNVALLNRLRDFVALAHAGPRAVGVARPGAFTADDRLLAARVVAAGVNRVEALLEALADGGPGDVASAGPVLGGGTRRPRRASSSNAVSARSVKASLVPAGQRGQLGPGLQHARQGSGVGVGQPCFAAPCEDLDGQNDPRRVPA
jgi:hypothetical protein